MARIYVSLVSPVGRVLDVLMVPIMYLVSGVLSESPQRTHRWNNRRLHQYEAWTLNKDMMVSVDGDSESRVRFVHYIPLFHIPILGGWKKYVVLKPSEDVTAWRVGWCAGVVHGVSRLVVRGPIRLLVGDSPASFFGINVETHEQIPLEIIGTGTVGDGGLYRNIPLL